MTTYEGIATHQKYLYDPTAIRHINQPLQHVSSLGTEVERLGQAWFEGIRRGVQRHRGCIYRTMSIRIPPTEIPEYVFDQADS